MCERVIPKNSTDERVIATTTGSISQETSLGIDSDVDDNSFLRDGTREVIRAQQDLQVPDHLGVFSNDG